MVRKIHGQLIEDFRADEASRRIAAALGYDRIRVYPRGSEWVRIELLIGDPLDGEVPAPLAGRGLSVSDVEITIARDELGNPLRQSWVEGPHVCIQGATRSGKSVWCYSALAQLARLDDVLIAGLTCLGCFWAVPTWVPGTTSGRPPGRPTLRHTGICWSAWSRRWTPGSGTCRLAGTSSPASMPGSR
ncbi:hypothetical protein Ae717Ps2_6865c [Pseudonocardia sp. Ae717_Ps2]|nr:hypothetical protein Ae717Ps2_6865c [Pseudonocardia sp. Ae717_Ps2]